jgi:hypothetical protein
MRWESAHQPFEVFLSDARCELNAGEAGGRKQLGKAAFGGRRINGHAVEQKLRAGGAQQQAGFIGYGNRRVQFIPGGVELLGRARMIKAIEPRIFKQDIEAADEGARGCLFGVDRIHRVAGAISPRPSSLTLVRAPSWNNGVRPPCGQRGTACPTGPVAVDVRALLVQNEGL